MADGKKHTDQLRHEKVATYPKEWLLTPEEQAEALAEAKREHAEIQAFLDKQNDE